MVLSQGKGGFVNPLLCPFDVSLIGGEAMAWDLGQT